MSVFFLPFDLIIAQIAHALLSESLGEVYILTHPVLGLSVVLGLGAVLQRRIAIPPVLPYGFAVIMAAGFILSGYIGSASWLYTTRLISLGVFPIIIVYILFKQDNKNGRYEIALVAGLCSWAILTIILYIIYFLNLLEQFPHLNKLTIDQKLLAARSPGEEVTSTNAFFMISGNVNKISNVALISIIIGFGVFVERFRGMIWFASIALIMCTIIIATLSRGTIIVALACGLASFAAAFLQPRSFRYKYVLLGIVLALPIVVCLNSPNLRTYFLELSSLNARIQQWKDVASSSSASPGADVSGSILPHLFFGYGPGRYGVITFGTPDAGTHNLLVDIWTDGGVVAATAFALLLLVPIGMGLSKLYRNWSHQIFVGLLGVFAVVALGLREYELAYLNTSAIGAVLLGWFIAFLVIHRTPVALERTNSDDTSLGI